MKTISEYPLQMMQSVFEKAIEDAYTAGVITGREGAQVEVLPRPEESKMNLQSIERDLDVGDKVRFIGPAEDYNSDVTVGNVYEIFEIDKDDFPCFADDTKDRMQPSFISLNYRHLFEKVDEPETKLKTVKRKAEIGERILIVDGYREGEIHTVFNVESSDVYKGVDVEGLPVDDDSWAFIKGEYEVIIEDEIPLQGIGEIAVTKNWRRHETIQRSKAFVEKYEAVRWGDEKKQSKTGNEIARSHWYETEFVRKGNRVTALIRGLSVGKYSQKTILHTGRSECSIGDVFNESIGKAIALARALEIDIPDEFMYAVQPTEIVVGMIVETLKEDNSIHVKGEITAIHNQNVLGFSKESYLEYIGHECEKTTLKHEDAIYVLRAIILDDTNAEYWSDSSEPQKD